MGRYFLLLFIGYSFSCSGQNQKLIDSLEGRLKLMKLADSNKVELLNALAFEYRTSNTPRSLELLRQAVTLSNTLKYPGGLALAYNHLGIIEKNQRHYDEAIQYHLKALKIRRKMNDLHGIASSYNNLGLTYDTRHDYTNAMMYYVKCLGIRERMNDTPGIAAAYHNIGHLYFFKKEFSKAKEYAMKSLALRMQIGDSFEVARNASSIGSICYEANEYEEALKWFRRALKIFGDVGDREEAAGVLNNIGNIYTETNRVTEGITYQEKALEIQRADQDTTGIITSMLSLAQAYITTGRYKDAESYLTTVLDMLHKSGGLAKMYADTYQLLGNLYRKINRPAKALEAYDNYERYKDSLISQENSKAVMELQEQYESEKKTLQLAKKDLALKKAGYELQKRKIFSIVMVCSLVLLGIIGYLLYVRYRLRKEQELDAALLAQQELRSKAVIEAEERERIRIAKDLHDGVGQQMAAVKLNLSSLEEDVDMDVHASEKYQAIVHMMDAAVKELREVSHSMMPNALIRKGLSAAVREFIDNIASSGLLKIDLQIVGLNNRLDGTTEMVLYRVLQECVSNIIKHAGATRINIELIKHDGYLSMVLDDNGCGFDSSDVTRFEGIGLKNIISRVEYLKGTVSFDSTPGRGTTVIVEIPISA